MKNITITINDCRTDLQSFFQKELKYYLKTKLNHTPFVVVDEVNNSINIVNKVTDLLNKFGSKPETKVLIQWRGQWNSDFFTFTVGELQQEVDKHNLENN